MKKQINYIILSITLVLCLIYFTYTIISTIEIQKNMGNIIGVVILTAFTISFIIMSFNLINKNIEFKGKHVIPITSLLLSVFITYNLFVTLNVISLSKEETLSNFMNENITEVINWASEKNISIEQVYEYSDTVPKNHIIRQNLKEGTLLKGVTKIEIVISNGPNYDEMVIVPSMFGWDIAEVIKFIDVNHLNNIKIDYIFSDEKRDVVMEQEKSGELRRSDEFTITFSLGKEGELGTIKMIDLKNKSLFDATLFLKKNGIKYELVYEFNKDVDRNYVIKQDKEPNIELDYSKDLVTLTISKGKEITVPDLINMKVEDITKWIVENNLKIKFENRYDESVLIGGIIESNKKKDDIIEEEELVLIVTSKGQLKMGSFNSLAEFRQWANEYSIQYKEEYEYNSISKGNIIRFSHKENDIVKNGDTIIIYISNGQPITIPDFTKKTKNSITTTCKSLGLNCTFYYSEYSTSAKDTALSQNKAVGSSVMIGTYVNIGLSKGASQTFTVQFNESQLSIGNPDETINTLKNWVANQYPNVTFTFTKKTSSVYENGGFIHESSPIKEGAKVTQGNSYQIWITTN